MHISRAGGYDEWWDSWLRWGTIDGRTGTNKAQTGKGTERVGFWSGAVLSTAKRGLQLLLYIVH